MPQLQFKYNLLKDIQCALEVYKKRKWLKAHDIKFFKPSLSRFLKIIFKRPKIIIKTKTPIICYWVSNGTWGAYEQPNKIIIMPFNLLSDMSLEDLIKHEIAHLEHPEADDMTHEEKEKYIESKT